MNRNVFPQVKGLLLTGYKCRRCFLLLLFLISLHVFFFLKAFAHKYPPQAKMVAVNVLLFVFDLDVGFAHLFIQRK